MRARSSKSARHCTGCTPSDSRLRVDQCTSQAHIPEHTGVWLEERSPVPGQRTRSRQRQRERKTVPECSSRWWWGVILIGAIHAATPSSDVLKVMISNNNFALQLLPLMSTSQLDNVFYSPYSVTTALAMVHAGADALTRSELHVALKYHLLGLEEDEVVRAHADFNRHLLGPSNSTLEVANAVVLDLKLNALSSYLNALKNGFEAELLKADFSGDERATLNTINSWVSQKTQQKISKLFDEPLPSFTKLVLLNAIYFKGTWLSKFDQSKTAKAPFYTADGRSTSVDTMQSVVKAGYAYVRDLAATMLELPYNGLDYSMVIALPQNESSVEVLKRQLNGTVIVAARQKLREATFMLHLPRFRLEQKYDLKEVLPKLGIKRIFNASEADLSTINGEKSLFVNQMVHKAVVEVNEEGSEAAAVTGVTVNTRIITGPGEIHVDRPFLFFIDNKRTGNVLFVGQVNKID
ncbi:hypothetical protein MRX96_059210 [Rhipicephalus microplus]